MKSIKALGFFLSPQSRLLSARTYEVCVWSACQFPVPVPPPGPRAQGSATPLFCGSIPNGILSLYTAVLFTRALNAICREYGAIWVADGGVFFKAILGGGLFFRLPTAIGGSGHGMTPSLGLMGLTKKHCASAGL